MNITELTEKYGKVTYEGKEYVLTERAYPAFASWAVGTRYHCIAMVICPTDEVNADGYYDIYRMDWTITQEWLESDRDNVELACDWEHPISVFQIGASYDLKNNRFIC